MTTQFLRQARAAGFTEDDLQEIAVAIAKNPRAGDPIVGTGGARKVRHGGRGKGKSGGFRTIHYFGGLDVPVFLLAVHGKGQKSDLTQTEKNELTKILPYIAIAYRRQVRKGS